LAEEEEEEEEEEENLFAKKAGCQKGLQPFHAGYHLDLSQKDSWCCSSTGISHSCE